MLSPFAKTGILVEVVLTQETIEWRQWKNELRR